MKKAIIALTVAAGLAIGFAANHLDSGSNSVAVIDDPINPKMVAVIDDPINPKIVQFIDDPINPK